MATVEEARTATLDSLVEALATCQKARNRTNDPKRLESLRKEARTLNCEIDRVQIAEINSRVPPPQVEAAIKDLQQTTNDLLAAQNRMRQTQQSLVDADEILDLAAKVIKIAAEIFV